MTLSYEDALATLQSMFGEPWTRDTLDAVLRHQKGHMENTVDFILRHSGKDPQVLADQLAEGINPDDSIVSLDAELARQLSQSAMTGRNSSSTPALRPQRGMPTVLPDDFLRVPGQSYVTQTTSTMESDEALARRLQNEMFIGSEATMRTSNMASLSRASTARGYPSSRPAQSVNDPQRGAPVMPSIPVNQVMSKISEIGDNARKRFQVFASQLNAKAQTLNTGGRSPAAPAAADGAAERTGLLDDNDHDGFEFAARKD